MFEEQTHQKKLSIFRHALKLQALGAGVFLQKLPATQLRKLGDNDPVADVLDNLDSIFKSCKDKSVDMASSIEAMLEEDEKQRIRGLVILAWRMDYDSTRRASKPKLVGALVMSDFVSTSNYSTDAESLGGDYETLQPYFHKAQYIDAVCSTHKGAGRLLIMAAYDVALQRKQGLIALSYSRRRNAVPESKKIFESLSFEPVIPTANFAIQMYGTWFYRSNSDLSLEGMSEDAVNVCTRVGLTRPDSLIWRC